MTRHAVDAAHGVGPTTLACTNCLGGFESFVSDDCLADEPFWHRALFWGGRGGLGGELNGVGKGAASSAVLAPMQASKPPSLDAE